jgi:hypothetical protein
LQTYTSPVFALASAQSTITIGFGIVEVYASDFVNVDPLLLHSGLVLDNIVFTTDVNTVVPEPATLWLLSLGLVGLLMWQRWYGAAPRALLKARQTRHDE